MNNRYTTIALWEQTRKKLRILAAHTGKSIVKIMDELVDRALKSINRGE